MASILSRPQCVNFTSESAWSLLIVWCLFGTRTSESNIVSKVFRRIITVEYARTRLHWGTKMYHVAGIYPMNLFFMLIELFACFQIQNLGMNRKNYHYLLCTMVSIKYLLRLYVRNFSEGSWNIYLHFMSFFHIGMTQVVEIFPQIRQGPTHSI